jgi:hypothetical protein
VDVLIYTGMDGAELVRAVDLATRYGVDFVTAAFIDARHVMGDEADRVERQARSSGARVLGTGLGAGFFLDLVPAILTTAMFEPEFVSARRVVDPTPWGPHIMRQIGIGQPPTDPQRGKAFLEQSAAVLAGGMGIELERLQWLPGPIIAVERCDIAGVVVEPGYVMGYDNRVHGIVNGKTIIEVGTRAEPGLLSRGVRVGIEYRIEAGSDDLSVEGFLAPPINGYRGNAARMLKSLEPLRWLPGGFYDPSHVPLRRAA